MILNLGELLQLHGPKHWPKHNTTVLALIHKCLRNAILVFLRQPVHLPVSNRVICIVHLWSSRLDGMVVAIGPVIQLLPTQ